MPVTEERCVPFVGCAQVPTGAFETRVTTIAAAVAVAPRCANLTAVARDARLRSARDGGSALVRRYARARARSRSLGLEALGDDAEARPPSRYAHALSASLEIESGAFLPSSDAMDVAWSVGELGCNLLGIDVCALSEVCAPLSLTTTDTNTIYA